MRKKILFAAVMLAALAVIVFLKGGVGFRSGVRVAYIESAGRAYWRAEYMKLDGYMTRSIRPESDGITVLTETESGDINIEICDSDGNAVLTAAGAGEYSAPAPDKAKVSIHADDHCGSFDIR